MLNLRLIILFIYAILLPIKASADYCQAVDFSHQTGPVKDQGQEGLCWLYSAQTAAQQAFKQEGIDFNPSAPDMARCASKGVSGRISPSLSKQTNGQGGTPFWPLQCLAQSGACSEETVGLKNYQKMLSDKDDLAELSSCIKSDQANCGQQRDALSNQSSEKNPLSVLGLDNSVASFTTCTENYNLLSSEQYCTNKMLLNQSCQENRKKLSTRPISENVPTSLNPQERAQKTKDKISKILGQEGRTPIIGVCLDNVQDEKLQKSLSLQGKNITSQGCQFPHALVVTGIDQNCNLKIQNSWGEDAPLNGNLDSNTTQSLLENVLDITHIPKAK